MSVQKGMVNAVDSQGKGLYRVGSISGIVLGFAFIVVIGLYIPVGAPPKGAEELLAYIAGNTGIWWAIVGFSVLTDFLFIPLALALYQAWKGINRNVMLLATACVGMFVILDLALTQMNYAIFIPLSASYADATNAAQMAALVAAATYPATVLASGLLFVYTTLTLSIGIFLTGLVMLKATSILNKATAYLGLATGILGSIAVLASFFTQALSITTILASVLTPVWAIFAGFGLYRLGRE